MLGMTSKAPGYFNEVDPHNAANGQKLLQKMQEADEKSVIKVQNKFEALPVGCAAPDGTDMVKVMKASNIQMEKQQHKTRRQHERQRERARETSSSHAFEAEPGQATANNQGLKQHFAPAIADEGVVGNTDSNTSARID